MKKKLFSHTQGFTLVEMLVVIGILALLAGLVIATLNPIAQFQKGRDAERKSDLSQIQKALEQYYQDTGSYPASNASFQIVGLNATAVPFGKSDLNDWPYMNQLPQDPDSNRTYVYYATNSNQTYYLYASLERSNDPQSCNGGAACNTLGGPGFPTVHACSPKQKPGITCNYGLTSPNTAP